MPDNYIKEYMFDDVLVLEPQDVLNHPSLWSNAVEKHIERGVKRMVWDLRNVHYVNSTGAGELVRAYTIALKNGCIVAVANFQQLVEDFLAIAKLLSVFDAYDSLEEAVRAAKTKSFRESLA